MHKILIIDAHSNGKSCGKGYSGRGYLGGFFQNKKN